MLQESAVASAPTPLRTVAVCPIWILVPIIMQPVGAPGHETQLWRALAAYQMQGFIPTTRQTGRVRRA